MKPYYDVVIVIPVGPGTKKEFLIDTMESYMHYAGSSFKFILADNSQEGLGDAVMKWKPDTDVLHLKKASGSMAGLYIALATAYSYALDTYQFRALFKLDTDALVIAAEPEKEALELFEKNERMGIAGQYPRDYAGHLWDVGWPRSRIINGTMTWKFIKRPVANVVLRTHYLRALRNGYRTGESVFGGAYFMNVTFLRVLKENKQLPNYTFRTLNLGEDHLFGLLAKSLGFELGDLSTSGLPFGCAWKGLPDSPEQLLNKRKKIIHSTRVWMGMNESEIREYFSEKRRLWSESSTDIAVTN